MTYLKEIKRKREKNQENSTQNIGENYLINHLVIYWIKLWRVGDFRASTGHDFFKTNFLVKAL